MLFLNQEGLIFRALFLLRILIKLETGKHLIDLDKCTPLDICLKKERKVSFLPLFLNHLR